jgi:cytochrome c5
MSTTRGAMVAVVACAIASALAVWPRTVETHGSINTTVLFDREIVRILERRCVACHNEGGLSFPLSSYEETWVQRLPIRTEVLRHHMPPWAAVPGYGDFANDNGLTLRETQFLISWVEGLGPRNAGSVFLNVPGAQQAPQPVRATAHVGHWQLGEPDLVRVLDPVRIEPGAGDVVRRVVLDLGLDRPRQVDALEYMPGDRSAVRAAAFSVQSSGQWLGSWTPWYGFAKLPDGVALRLPAGARVVAEIHYRAGKEPVDDRGALGLFFADRPAAITPSDLVLDARSALAPSAARGATPVARASVRLTTDTTVWALKPDVQPGTMSLELSARLPDGATQVLLLVQNPSAAWPTTYILKSPVRLRRGSELRFATRQVRTAVPARLVISRY